MILDHSRPHLSASQVNRYATCGLQWYFSKQYTPSFISGCLVFGKAFHKGIETFYQGRLEGKEIGVEDMLLAYANSFDSTEEEIKFNKTDSPEGFLVKAEAMYRAFLKVVKPSIVIAVEEGISCSLDDELPPFIGYIDLIELREIEGKEAICLVDFKTAAHAPKPQDVQPDQLLIYAMAAQKLGILDDIAHDGALHLNYTYITKTKMPQVIEVPVEVTDSAIERVLAKIRQCYKGMKEEIFFPCPGWQCSGCGYQEHCQKWPNL